MSDFKKLLVWQKAHTMALDAHRVLIACRDMDVISEVDSLTLPNQVIEVRKMLHGLIRKLTAGNSSARSSKRNTSRTGEVS